MTFDPTPLPALPRRRRDAHKGDFGRVLILAGSRGLIGAAALAAEGALRGGAGLVTVGCPLSCYPILAAKLTCAMTLPLAETAAGSLARSALDDIEDRLATSDVLAIGPGLGRDPDTSALARAVIARAEVPWVAEADALNALAGEQGGGADDALLACARARGVLTPHPGEMARLLGASVAQVQQDREGAARAFAGRFDHVLVLKGHGTLVADGDRLWRCDAGNPGMASGGTGDVLTGVIAALLAEGIPPYDAARVGVQVHAAAGDLGARALGERALLATDLVDSLPSAFRALEAGGG